MVVSLIVASVFTFVVEAPEDASVWWSLSTTALPVAITTAAWVLACFLTPKTEESKLRHFYLTVKPGGPGWRKVREAAARDRQPLDGAGKSWGVPFACALLGCLAVYGAIFATGSWIYGHTLQAIIGMLGTFALVGLLVKFWGQTETT